MIRRLSVHQTIFVRTGAQFGRVLRTARTYVAYTQKNKEVMEWTNDKPLVLIDEYEKFPILWDAKHPLHFSRIKKNDAWDQLSMNLRSDVAQVKQKLNSLLGSFRREKSKGRKSIGTGKARKEIYVSKWFAFERMHYLLDKDDPRNTIDTEKENDEEQEVDLNLTSSNFDPEQNVPNEGDQNSNQNEETEPFITPVPPKQKRRKVSDKNKDARLDEAFKILKQTVTTTEKPPDDCTIYSQHVANKLRTYSIRTRAHVEHAINNILFEADIGKYDHPPPNAIPQYYFNAAPISQYPVTHFLGDHRTVPSPLSSPAPSHASSTSSISNCPTPMSDYIQDNDFQNL